MANDRIVIRGAREHNLKSIDLELPRDQLVVITGLSGSGKSSLAFDTIYAEGQRRYVESLSAYARQFLEQMEKPDVDGIEGLSPAISIEQKTTSKNPRSTVGTVTEIYDYLRVLFARVGTPHCPRCGNVISAQTVQQMVDRVLTLPVASRPRWPWIAGAGGALALLVALAGTRSASDWSRRLGHGSRQGALLVGLLKDAGPTGTLAHLETLALLSDSGAPFLRLPEASLRHAEAAVQGAPDDPEVLLALARAQVENLDFESARAVLSSLVDDEGRLLPKVAVALGTLQELERRERAYRGERPSPAIAGQTVILVDDGVATGSTMKAAIEALREERPASIVVEIKRSSMSRFMRRAERWIMPRFCTTG